MNHSISCPHCNGTIPIIYEVVLATTTNHRPEVMVCPYCGARVALVWDGDRWEADGLVAGR